MLPGVLPPWKVSQLDDLKKNIYFKVIESDRPGAELKRIREIVGVGVTELSRAMGRTPSVISDLERGRMGSPKITTIRSYVNALLDVAGEKARYAKVVTPVEHSTYFPKPLTAREVKKLFNARIIRNRELLETKIYGLVVVNHLSLLRNLATALNEFYRYYGESTEICVLFKNVILAGGPIALVRIQPMKPRMMLINKPKIRRLGIKTLAPKVMGVKGTIIGFMSLTDKRIEETISDIERRVGQLYK